jgi:hypothetical protein
MNIQTHTPLALLVLIGPMIAMPAYAQDTLTFGADLELEVTDDTGVFTATPYVEYQTASGIYVGADISNVDSDDDNYASSAYVGYAGDIGMISYDIYYGHYYLDQTGDDGEEAIVTVGYPVFGGLTMSTAFITDLDGGDSIEQSAYYALPAGYELSAAYEFGQTSSVADSWDLGVSKELSDTVALDWRYYDGEDDDPSIAMTVSFATDVTN